MDLSNKIVDRESEAERLRQQLREKEKALHGRAEQISRLQFLLAEQTKRLDTSRREFLQELDCLRKELQLRQTGGSRPARDYRFLDASEPPSPTLHHLHAMPRLCR